MQVIINTNQSQEHFFSKNDIFLGIFRYKKENSNLLQTNYKDKTQIQENKSIPFSNET